jgi:transcriptional regulator with AAA-type ATPase domain
MPIFKTAELAFVESISNLSYCNPFLPERIHFEKQALGDDFVEDGSQWNINSLSTSKDQPNLQRIYERTERIIGEVRKRVEKDQKFQAKEVELFETLVLFYLYHRFLQPLQDAVERTERGREADFSFYREFESLGKELLTVPGVEFPGRNQLDHAFAVFFQLRRAFHHIFHQIVGISAPFIRLRAAVWQSIFTCDLHRYRRGMFERMGDYTCLITGASGTGKELVARAIGLSRYIPFDREHLNFLSEAGACFFPLNLSALSPTLIESELFGHKRGAFTGAVQDRSGWFEVCPASGTVFLDEIGELAPALQVKLLRVLQTRTFQRLGETKDRKFQGKIIAATNRDLATEIRENRFRRDFYYRICSDIIQTPSLYEQLKDHPEQLSELVLFIAKRELGEDEGAILGEEAFSWIQKNLPRDYAWPGNVRELEQCVRNIMIRGEYAPPDIGAFAQNDPLADTLARFRAGRLTVDELLTRYCSLVFTQTGNYAEMARLLEIDRRTAKSKVDSDWCERFKPTQQ